MYTQDDLCKHPVWRHVATNSLYHVMATAMCSTNGEEGNIVVVYFSMSYQGMRYRDIEEFLDGRFVPELPENK